jgi:hypothetical protein
VPCPALGHAQYKAESCAGSAASIGAPEGSGRADVLPLYKSRRHTELELLNAAEDTFGSGSDACTCPLPPFKRKMAHDVAAASMGFAHA